MRFLINIIQIANNIITKFIKSFIDFIINGGTRNNQESSLIHIVYNDNSSLQDNKVYSYRGWLLHNKNDVYYAMKDGRRIVSRNKDFKELESIIDFEESLR